MFDFGVSQLTYQTLYLVGECSSDFLLNREWIAAEENNCSIFDVFIHSLLWSEFEDIQNYAKFCMFLAPFGSL